jgi:hypothetical protein
MVVKVVIAVIFTIAAHIIVAIHDLIVCRQTLTDINSGEFTFDCTKDGFTWTLPSDKPLRTTNEIVSYIDANGNQCKVQAEVKYYGMGHDPLWTIAIPNVVEAENECVCESLL